MSIRVNLAKARESIRKDVTGLGVAGDIREAAIEAITHGINSDQGRKYMALFCDNKNELARMTVVSSDDANYMPQMRAYTPADAVCIPGTNNGFAARILGINVALEPVADADVPAETPEPSAIRDDALFQKLQQG
jgi:hypothetical protein